MTEKLSKDSKEKTARLSVTFPLEVYVELERLAKKRKVSVAWVVRDAAEKYITEEYPLLRDL